MIPDWFKQLDRVLRGEATSPQDLRQADIRIDLGGITFVLVLLGMVAGLCTGSYAVFREGGPSWEQLVASTFKVPLLFLLTLMVTFPSLYVFNALVGSRLRLLPVLRLLVASLAVNLAVLASLGPIVAFFAVSTSSYHFMVLLNVVVYGVAGVLGLMFLLQTLNRLTRLPDPLAGEPYPHEQAKTPAPVGDSVDDSDSGEAPLAAEIVAESPSALELAAGQSMHPHVKKVFGLWIIVFSLVGAQMGWVLRPFIGSPGTEFAWFRERESNFFEAVLLTIAQLLTSGGRGW